MVIETSEGNNDPSRYQPSPTVKWLCERVDSSIQRFNFLTLLLHQEASQLSIYFVIREGTETGSTLQ